MKKLNILVFSLLFLTSCSFSAYHPTLFNNKVLELVQPSTLAIQDSAIVYNSSLPSQINEETEIDLSELKTQFKKSTDLFMATKKTLNYESQNLEQQSEVINQLNTYHLAGEAYLNAMEAVIQYFDSEEYKSDPTKLSTLDEALHDSYNIFVEANNDLSLTLSKFIAEPENQ